MNFTLTNTQTSLIYFCTALLICFGLNLDIFKDYAFLDAYELIYTADRVHNFYSLFIENGRPLYGIWCEYLYGYFFETITELKWPRAFATLCCIVFSTQLFKFLISIGFKTYESGVFALLVLALPTFTVYFAWSTTSQIPLLLITNFYAGELLLKGFNKQRVLWVPVIVSLLIIVTSMFLYQSTATTFILPFLIKTIKTNEFDLKVVQKYIVFTFFCYLFYYLIFKLTINISGLEAANRTSPNLLVFTKKIIKFFIFELRTLVKNSGFLILPKLSLVIGIVSFCGFFILKKKQKIGLYFLSSLILVLLFCYSPYLLSGQNYFSLRTISTTAIVVLFYQFYFLRHLVLKYKKLKFGLAFLTISLLVLSFFNQRKYVAGLQHEEYAILKKAFESFDINNVDKLTIIIPKHNHLQKYGNLKNGFSDEFGRLSSAKIWAPNHLFSQIKWEQKNTETKEEVFPVGNITVSTLENLKNRNPKNTINLEELFIIKIPKK